MGFGVAAHKKKLLDSAVAKPTQDPPTGPGRAHPVRTRDEVMTTAKLKGLLGDAAFVGTRDVCADGKQGKLTGLQQITGQRYDRQSAIFKI